MADPILVVDDLYTHFITREDGVVKAVNGVSFALDAGQVVGLVGESGSGKTMTAISILNIVPQPGQILGGTIAYKGHDLLELSEEELRHVRGEEISMIFQDPVASLNPVLTIGQQVLEVIEAHRPRTPAQVARDMAVRALESVGLPDAQEMMDRFAFQLSGGMAQRVMLAMALMMEPDVLIADEPTSALDVTLQAEIMERLRALKEERGTAILLITHDMGVIAQMADDVLVMYAGSIVEHADPISIFKRPAHPYTWALLQSMPRLDRDSSVLRPLPGSPPDLKDMPDECPFIPRCHRATTECRTSPRPLQQEIAPAQWVACYNPIPPPMEEEAG